MPATSMQRLTACALLMLGACGSAPAPGADDGTAWLVDQYFAGRQTIVLLDLTGPISVSAGIYAPGPARPEGAPIDYAGGHGMGSAMRNYYPFLGSGGYGGEYAVRYPAGDAAAIVRHESEQADTIAKFGRGPLNFLQLRAVPADVVGGLAGAARAGKWAVAYTAPGCVVATRQGVRAEQRFITVFLGGDGPVWDLNDAGIERCALAGMLQAFGIDPAPVMARADTLYPHRAAPNPCPIATAARMAALDPNDAWRNDLRCKSGARAAWPFAVLRHAVETGGLKAGPIDRAAFAAAMAKAAQDLGEAQRNKVLGREDSMLRLAGSGEIPSPVTR